MRKARTAAKLCLMCGCLAGTAANAETGYDAWLRYPAVDKAHAVLYRQKLPAVIIVLGDSQMAGSAREEIIRGVRGMLGRTLRVESRWPRESAVVLGTIGEIRQAAPDWKLLATLPEDGYLLKTVTKDGSNYLLVAGSNDRGILYGAFALLRKVALHQTIDALDEQQAPYSPIRWVNQWDNLDGTIERGFGGRSIFWENQHARSDLSRVNDYGRMLASVGINGCTINNVNANVAVITPAFLPEVSRIAAAFRPWGIRVSLAVDLGSPKLVGGLDTFDPLDSKVAAWWKSKVDAIYEAVPDLAGFVIKADSEGRVGPSTYGRTHADAANVVARALRPHGGLLFYRGFVYDHHMDWRNPKNDRARAAYDNFKALDGRFDDNAFVQVKFGPIDFQVREPVSPLFGALEKTNQVIEFAVMQEYLGQGRHTVFLVPQWKDVLDFDMHAGAAPTPVKALAGGKVFHRKGGFVGVANVGLGDAWLGNQLSQANLFGFGRLAWNPDLSARQIIDEWTRLTFSNDPALVETVSGIQLSSWRTYENYTGPLGLQTLTDIVGNHYGVAVEASERNGWGQWHFADEKGVGMERTRNGTGYTGQYRPAVMRRYESLSECPDDLVLFMHHVPYTHVLHSGKTVIQSIYDSHYEGAESVAGYVRRWKLLQGRLDEQRFQQIQTQLEYQAGQAEVWRDAVVNWFLRASGVPDAKGRAGHHPGRFEAEGMKLDQYTIADVAPWEAASGGQAVECKAPSCTASFRYEGAGGWFNLRVRYFDQNNGVSHFRVWVGGQLVDQWQASELLPTKKIDASSSMLRTIAGVALRPGDDVKIEGIPDGGELASLDYLEIRAAR